MSVSSIWWWAEKQDNKLQWLFNAPTLNNTFTGTFLYDITDNRQWYFPDKNGTLATLDDVQAVTTYFQSNRIIVWLNEFQLRGTYSNVLSTLYTDVLPANSVGSVGGFATFNYIVEAAANSNAKYVYVKFANQPVLNITVSTSFSGYINIEGKVKLLQTNSNPTLNVWSYSVSWWSNGVAPTFTYGQLTGIDFTVDNLMLLQGQGIANKDIQAIEASGILGIYAPYSTSMIP